MSDREDLRRRAAQQASIGNYWAGKCLGLLDEVERLTELLAMLRPAAQAGAGQ